MVELCYIGVCYHDSAQSPSYCTCCRTAPMLHGKNSFYLFSLTFLICKPLWVPPIAFHMQYVSCRPICTLFIGSFSKRERVGRSPSFPCASCCRSGRGEEQAPGLLECAPKKQCNNSSSWALHKLKVRGLDQIILFSSMLGFETDSVKIIKISFEQLLF